MGPSSPIFAVRGGNAPSHSKNGGIPWIYTLNTLYGYPESLPFVKAEMSVLWYIMSMSIMSIIHNWLTK